MGKPRILVITIYTTVKYRKEKSPVQQKPTTITMPVTLYGFGRSPACRAVMLTIRAIGLNAEFKNVDLTTGEQKTEEFKKINPAGQVPVLDDNGLYIWESCAINSYLVNQYGKDDTLYPKDPKKRAIVDTLLYFDTSSLTCSIREYYVPQMFLGKPADPAREAAVRDKLTILNTILGQRSYTAGDNITIADFGIISTLSMLQAAKFNCDSYPNVINWINKVIANVPFYDEVTKPGFEALRLLVHERLTI